MEIREIAVHCEKAWSEYAQQQGIQRDDHFYFFKLQEELGELVRSYLELNAMERKTCEDKKLQEKFHGDIASVIGNALILANHFHVNIENEIVKKFPIKKL